jgi:hypothetical protein
MRPGLHEHLGGLRLGGLRLGGSVAYCLHVWPRVELHAVLCLGGLLAASYRGMSRGR